MSVADAGQKQTGNDVYDSLLSELSDRLKDKTTCVSFTCERLLYLIVDEI